MLRMIAIEDQTIQVISPTSSYDVVVGFGLLSRISQRVTKQGQVAIITDTNVGPLYADALASQWADAVVITLPAGEKYKTLASVAKIYDQLLAAGIDRK